MCIDCAHLPENIEILKALIADMNAALVDRDAIITGHLVHIAQMALTWGDLQRHEFLGQDFF